MKILITGSSGFVGSRIVELAIDKGFEVVAQVRGKNRDPVNGIQVVATEIDSNTDWSSVFNDICCVVHCAACVVQMKKLERCNALASYRAVNTEGTLNLARQAERGGVKRFVFISSIKVNGEFTKRGIPFNSKIYFKQNREPYGVSKLEAEIGLRHIAKATGLEVVIIRPPLVYGEGVKGNFYNLMELIYKGFPLPFGAVYNQRSLVYRDNLVDLILLCCYSKDAIGKTFLVSDGLDLSTTRLIEIISKAMGKPCRLFPIPVTWIEWGAKMLGWHQIFQKILGNLQVDISDTKRMLSWEPPISYEEGIVRTVDSYLNDRVLP
ncbi:NAD-dependent epimerase/dehydratase family protein [Candidatus Photodesmus blepharus]|uniref:NAD-dependent epimerase/dehydratase family protein n=1 Tax=Candidatus Photodesmus blepharonis TaxID=1179155 RepID=UPI0005586252|nr:NAD-dependent epimerase/dehydratase family protein [Candidatus Photodesmus blepharus]